MALTLAVGLAVGLTLGAAPVASAQATTWEVPRTRPQAVGASLDTFEVALMVEINDARLAHGLRRIRWFDSCVDTLAERWARRLARSGELVHRDLSTLMRRCDAQWAGETLASGTGLGPRRMVRMWMDSPGHRAILLSRRPNRAGVAVARGRDGTLVGVLNVVRVG